MTQHRRSRREFIGLTGAGLAGVVGATRLGSTAGAAAIPDPQDADLVGHNAVVYTMDPAAPRAEGFAVKGGGSWPSAAARRCGRSPARARRPSTQSR